MTSADPSIAAPDVVSFPGAKPHDRTRTVDSNGVQLAVHEWGEPGAPPLLLAHGGFDFARTFDVFAPLLADAGWRVVAWDHRGHGDSAHAALYHWEADVRDAFAVLDSTTQEPVPLIGHSKGGSLLLQLAEAFPHRVSHVVNLDGLPFRRLGPDVADHQRTKMLQTDVTGWLEHRRRLVVAVRKPGTIDELAQRRGRMNPRHSHEWLRYLVTVGARQDPDGWRWKIDPTLRPGGFGPWRPEWSVMRLANIGAPLLAVFGVEPEQMGWGTRVRDIEPFLPPTARALELDGVGHFLHIERPREIADLVLEAISA